MNSERNASSDSASQDKSGWQKSRTSIQDSDVFSLTAIDLQLTAATSTNLGLLFTDSAYLVLQNDKMPLGKHKGLGCKASCCRKHHRP